MEKFKKLTPHDLAFGIGRKATREELEELFSRPRSGKLMTAEEMLAELKRRNEEKKIKKLRECPIYRRSVYYSTRNFRLYR
ncbi:MAG: hypothetical protein JST83_11215 [Bacteroidetes bacterium]|nr:hypothetical protein [Bacteroidota bacterium]